ncbi:MAG TPA: hypothetical protein DER64_22455 [Planctomycetaceae bacterium]|nr:hypothetical protein [Planctomycetaceae bacterium]
MRRMAHWQALMRPVVSAFCLVLVLVPAAVGQQAVEVLTLRDQPQPVATGGGFVLAGEKVSGRLVSLTKAGVTVEGKEGRFPLVPTGQVLDIRFPLTERVSKPPKPVAAWVRMVDGSRIGCRAVVATPRQVKLQTRHLGEMAVPAARISAVRFGKAERGVVDSWRDLLVREIKRDRLVILKGKTLDYLDGVVGEINDKQVNFLLDGDEIPVPLERVYGIIFFRKATSQAVSPKVCQAALRGGDTFGLTAVSVEGKTCQGVLAGGAKVSLPVAQLERLDFAASRIIYLSAMTPRDVEHVPYFDVTWKYRRDRNLDGGPLKVGGQRFARGLALHSKTRLVYSLAARHRRFQAWMGIDALVGRRGNVHVVISADGKTLLETDVKGTDKPRLVDLDVTGRRQLQILVDFGGDLDIADHLDLAEARLIR